MHVDKKMNHDNDLQRRSRILLLVGYCDYRLEHLPL